MLILILSLGGFICLIGCSPLVNHILLLLALTPVLYLLWLLVYLLLSAIEMRLIGLFWKKPKRLDIDTEKPQFKSAISFFLIQLVYHRQMIIKVLPLASLFFNFNFPALHWLRVLYYQAYCPGKIDIETSFFGIMYSLQDPDLICLEENVIVGSNVEFVGHTLKRQHNKIIYASAPIHVGAGSTIGGNAVVGMGVNIGENSVVEMASYVAPFTRIPNGEVWGGHPAVPLYQHERFSEWDSLAKLSIAREIYDKFGLSLSFDILQKAESQASLVDMVEKSLEAAKLFKDKKVLVIDADNTLWRGILGEGGIETIYDDVQEKFLNLKKQGYLLALTSKNDDKDVWQAFQSTPSMPLKQSDFAAYRINWSPKSENLQQLATELNLAINSFVFIDDSLQEREEIKQCLPEVCVIDSADNNQLLTILDAVSHIASHQITQEDKLRADYYQQEKQRLEYKKSVPSYEDYIKSLEIKLDIHQAQTEEFQRIAQLSKRVTQFNLNLRKYDEDELQELSTKHNVYVLQVSDRFGDYGLVGAMMLRFEGDICIIDSLLISCRALGRGIEKQFFDVVKDKISADNIHKMTAKYIEGPRNYLAKDFLIGEGFVLNQHGVYELSL